MRKAVLVRDSQEGDWEALYIDGELVDQTHRVDLPYWLQEYGLIEYRRIDMEANNLSRLPKTLDDLPE